jgi:hypothetical protein
VPLNTILPYHAAANAIFTTLYAARGEALATSPQFTDLVRAQAYLLDSVLVDRPFEKSKKSKERGALTRTWRTARKVGAPESTADLKLGPLLNNVIQSLLKTKDFQAVRSTALLGSIVGVAMRLKVKASSQGVGQVIVDENKVGQIRKADLTSRTLFLHSTSRTSSAQRQLFLRTV